jgi:hypothetical protein
MVLSGGVLDSASSPCSLFPLLTFPARPSSACQILQRIAMTLTRWHASPRGYALIHDSGAQPVDDYQFCSW